MAVSNKKDLKTAYAVFLKTAKLSQTVNDLPQEFLKELLGKMPLVYSEMPDPIFQVQIVMQPGRSAYRCLHIWKTSKWVPITATKIFRVSGSSDKKDRVVAALRMVIKPQIDDFKAEVMFPIACPLTGQKLTNFRFTHVDHHQIPFRDLVLEWLKVVHLKHEQIGLNRKGDIGDQDLRRSWYLYHKQYADLQLVDAKANMSKGARRPVNVK